MSPVILCSLSPALMGHSGAVSLTLYLLPLLTHGALTLSQQNLGHSLLYTVKTDSTQLQYREQYYTVYKAYICIRYWKSAFNFELNVFIICYVNAAHNCAMSGPTGPNPRKHAVSEYNKEHSKLLNVPSCKVWNVLWPGMEYECTLRREADQNKPSLSAGSRDSIMEMWRNGTIKKRLHLPEQQKGSQAIFSSVLLLPEVHTCTLSLPMWEDFITANCKVWPICWFCIWALDRRAVERVCQLRRGLYLAHKGPEQAVSSGDVARLLRMSVHDQS